MIVDRATNKPLAGDPSQLAIAGRTKVVKRGQSLGTLLRDNGIVPDGEAIAAAYRLNPGLRAGDIAEGMVVVVPAVVGPAWATAALGNGYVAYLTVDLSQKLLFQERSEVLGSEVAKLLAANPARVNGTESARQLLFDVQRISAKARAIELGIRARTRPVDSTLLALLIDEVTLATNQVRGLRGREPTSQDQTFLNAIAEDLTVHAAYWTDTYGGVSQASSEPYPRALVHIRTQSAERKEITGLRVFWVEEARYKWHTATPMLQTSAVTDSMAVANYAMWAAAADDSSGAPVTVVLKRVEVRQKCLPGKQRGADSSANCAQLIELTLKR